MDKIVGTVKVINLPNSGPHKGHFIGRKAGKSWCIKCRVVVTEQPSEATDA